jgi:hypothetical protein
LGGVETTVRPIRFVIYLRSLLFFICFGLLQAGREKFPLKPRQAGLLLVPYEVKEGL